ncbi:MAG: transcriptional antiterminator, Rof [Bacteroidota bacterium]|nr:transcriptional antiterminator, Rof [Bacteroidota bacterium]
MSEDPEYRPIDCSLYDEWELACIRRKPITVALRTDDEEVVLTLHPKTLSTRDNGEFLITEENAEYRLDRLRFL